MTGSNPSYNDDTRIRGDTDETLIGNVDDHLKITQEGAGNPPGGITSTKYRILALSEVTGIDTFETMYTYSGSGLFHGFMLDFDSLNIIVRLTIDGEEIFELQANNNFSGTDEWCGLGIKASTDVVRFCATPYPIKYDTSVLIEAEKGGGPDKDLEGGFVFLTQET